MAISAVLNNYPTPCKLFKLSVKHHDDYAFQPNMIITSMLQ